MKTTAILILTLALGALALAQDAAVPDWFKKLDRNGDGKIAREEMPKLFDLIDTNKDGVASLEEVTDYFAKHPPQRGVPAEYHVIKGITHYGIYKEGFDEATNLEVAWFDKHLKGGPDAPVRQSAPKEEVDKNVRPTPGAKPAAPAPEAKPASGAQRSPEEVFTDLDIVGVGKLNESKFGELKEQ